MPNLKIALDDILLGVADSSSIANDVRCGPTESTLTALVGGESGNGKA